MRTPYLTLQMSAISDHQRYSILANDLVKRLSNINIERVGQEEVIQIVERFILLLNRRKYEMDEEEQAELDGRLALKRAKRPPAENQVPGGVQEYRRAGLNQREIEENKNTIPKTMDKNKAKAVLFLPYTIGSTLERELERQRRT